MNPIYAPVRRFGMLSTMSKRSDSALRWRAILRRQAGSGLSVAAFCRRSRIPQASFYVWRRKLRDATTFAEVRVGRTPEPDGGAFESRLPCDAGALELVLPHGRSIVVRPGFDRATLLALVDALAHGVSEDGVACRRRAVQSVIAKRESGA